MRTIDKDALLSDIERTIGESGCVNHEGEIMDCVRYAPTIDAVPAVRCNECKYYSAPVVARDTGLCLWADRDELAAPDGYCSHGATKESIK